MQKLQKSRRVLIVGEGRETEYNYFSRFKLDFEAELAATSTVVEVRRGCGGNARGIVETAIKESIKFKPNHGLQDKVYLLIDTEGANRAIELPEANRLAHEKKIDLVYSSPSFEYWLLCHFDKPKRRYFTSCSDVVSELNKKWSLISRNSYDKADKEIFSKVSDRLESARINALETDLHHIRNESIAQYAGANPSSQVYELIARLIGIRGDLKCPVEGVWHPIGTRRIDVAKSSGESEAGNLGEQFLEKGVAFPKDPKLDPIWRLRED